MTFNIYNSLIIAGIIQGFIFVGAVLSFKKYRAKSTYFLVALIFCYSLSNLMYLLPDIGAISLLQMYKYVYFPWASILGPLVYFYVVLFLNPSRKSKTFEKLFFLPFLILFALTIMFRGCILVGYENDAFYAYYTYLIIYHEVFAVLYTLIFILFSIKIVLDYEKTHQIFSRTIIRNDVIWLKITFSIMLLLTVLWGILTFKNTFVEHVETGYYVLWVGMAATIYWLGYMGIYKFGVARDRKKIRKYLNSQNAISSEKNNISSSYSSSKHSNQYIEALEKLLLQDKIYLDSNLSLDNVAEHLNLSPSYLSRIIHNELNTSFPDYLNSFRIEEAKNYLKNPDFAKYTIVSIGLEAGFNSKSSFYNVFKKATGKTPLAYQSGLNSK